MFLLDDADISSVASNLDVQKLDLDAAYNGRFNHMSKPLL